MGKRDPRQMPRAPRRLCGQVSIVPSGVDDQSLARTAEPISPPPTNQQAEEVGSGAGCLVDAGSTMPPFPPSDQSATKYALGVKSIQTWASALVDLVLAISHTKKCIEAPNQRKLLCGNDFLKIRGCPDRRSRIRLRFSPKVAEHTHEDPCVRISLIGPRHCRHWRRAKDQCYATHKAALPRSVINFRRLILPRAGAQEMQWDYQFSALTL